MLTDPVGAFRSARPCPGPHINDPPLTGLPLCDSCRRRLDKATDARHPVGLPTLTRELHRRLSPESAADRPKVSGSHERPLPIRGDVYELSRQIEDVALSWAEVVADAVGINPARTVADALYLLHLQTDRLLAIPTWPMRRSVTFDLDGTIPGSTGDELGQTMAGGALIIREIDGPGGACELLELTIRARRLLGYVRSRTALPLPCPRCTQQTLTMWAGSDTVDCDNDECSYRIGYGDYDRLVRSILRMNRRDR